jgi:inhibitor of KinA
MRVVPIGDRALTLAWDSPLDEALLQRLRSVADALRAARLPGVIDAMAAFSDVTVYYRIERARSYDELLVAVQRIARDAFAEATAPAVSDRLVEIPVCYEQECGPDLAEVAQRAGLTPAAVIERHQSAEYRVEAIGFVPGFAYLGGLDASLHTPRRATPRAAVPRGSVGIGGAQTGIYALETPGGWNLIGRTPLMLFDPQRPQPALLRAGDRVRFRAIPAEEFRAWK